MEEPQDELIISGFPLGLNVTAKDGALGPSGARQLRGVTPDYDGGLRHAGNFAEIVPDTYDIIGFIRWSHGDEDRLLFVADVFGQYKIYVWDEGAGSLDRTIDYDPVNDGMGGTSGPSFVRFVQAGLNGEVFVLIQNDQGSHLFYIQDPLTDTEAIDVSLPVTGVAGGLDPVVDPLVQAYPEGTGDLDSTNLARYQYAIQLKDNKGRLSQVSFPSLPVSAVGQWMRLYLFGVSPAAVTAGDIVSALVYRIGGKASQLRLTKEYELAVSGGLVVDAATGLEIVDMVTEEDLSFIFAPTYADPAPEGMNDIILHQSKIFGIKGTGLHYSRTNDFLYWGSDDNGVDDDGGVIYPDNNTGDRMNGLTSEGSLLVVGREVSVLTLYGAGVEQFAFDKRANFGNSNRHSMCRADNESFYFSRDDLLRSLRDTSSPSVSPQMEKQFKSLDDEDLSDVVIAHHNSEIYVSIPLPGGASSPFGLCYVYSTQRGIWREATELPLVARAMHSYPNPDTGELELLSAARSGGIYSCEAYNDGTAGTERKVIIQTDKLLFPAQMIGRFESLIIEGSMVNSGTDPMLATLTAGGVTKTYPLVQSGDRLMYYTGLPPDLAGRHIQLTLSGSLLAGEIRRVAIGTLELRRSS